ncbi:potassium-transporting ATPase subunit KdpA [Paenibacillus xylanexedens]|uniref:potassium-transporting ATPase subunit KdpA n=1 Tax=Paenibacillus xylanexedens TaxID=528191 RepID=UPI0011A81AA2|nr:potassium-transporting ATPase subunit KdpA [Paenibacillus xylanexedens]
MPKYRKKPVVIEAVQFNIGDPQPEWFTGAIFNGVIQVFDDHATITTLEGVMTANLGDYIIKGVQGEIYPCKPEIFRATYETVPVESPQEDVYYNGL